MRWRLSDVEGADDLIRFRVGGSGGSEDGRGRLLDAGGGVRGRTFPRGGGSAGDGRGVVVVVGLCMVVGDRGI